MTVGPRVLVVGAGPVGLVAALLLRHRGIEVDIVDGRRSAVSESRATDLRAGTLLTLDGCGVTPQLLDRGQRVDRVVLHCGGRTTGILPTGVAGSPYPFVLVVPQSTTEALLHEHLTRAGAAVERGTEVVDLRQTGGPVDVTVRSIGTAGPTEQRTYDWVLACDGARSTVRTVLGMGFPGRSTSSASVITDIEADLPFPRDEVHLVLHGDGGVHILPMPAEGSFRIMANRWPGRSGHPAAPDDVVALIRHRLGAEDIGPARVLWSSAFTMHRRIADRFRVGRILLAGDAAHICPPIGGQGLNSGVADVAAWVPALDAVLRGSADERVLEAVAARRRRATVLSGRIAWGAVLVDAPNRPVLAAARDAVAPLALLVGRRPLAAWLAGALDR